MVTVHIPRHVGDRPRVDEHAQARMKARARDATTRRGREFWGQNDDDDILISMRANETRAR